MLLEVAGINSGGRNLWRRRWGWVAGDLERETREREVKLCVCFWSDKMGEVVRVGVFIGECNGWDFS